MLDGACNAIRCFITASFTPPHTRRYRGSSLFDRSRFRLVHSGLCQYYYILAICGYEPPAYHSRPPLARFCPTAVLLLAHKASVFSRLQRAVSVQEIALPFLQRSLRGSVSGRYPFIPLLGIPVRKSRNLSAFPAAFTSFQALGPVKVYLQQRVAAQLLPSDRVGLRRSITAT